MATSAAPAAAACPCQNYPPGVGVFASTKSLACTQHTVGCQGRAGGQFCDAGGTGHDDCFGHARLPICSFIAAIRVIGAGQASDRCALGPGGLPMPEPIRLRRERSHPRDPRPTPWLNSRTPQSRAEVPSLSDSPGTGRTRRACPRPVHPRARARTPGCRLGIPQTRTRSFQAEDSRTNRKGRPR